jgi:hypothetical protein
MPLVLGLGFLALGAVLMIVWRVRNPSYFDSER